MKYFKILIVLSVSLLVISCGTVKKGFSNQKKNNSDEFLVEKKTPLVMPPNYKELPEPKTNQQEIKKEKNPIKSLLLQDDDLLNDNEIDNKDKKLEDSLLKKIKEN